MNSDSVKIEIAYYNFKEENKRIKINDRQLN